jgi:hypothetical protein
LGTKKSGEQTAALHAEQIAAMNALLIEQVYIHALNVFCN